MVSLSASAANICGKVISITAHSGTASVSEDCSSVVIKKDDGTTVTEKVNGSAPTNLLVAARINNLEVCLSRADYVRGFLAATLK
jgi:hypothetical protein